MNIKENWPEYILRIAVFGTFLGHGIFALKHNMAWVPFLTFWGFSPETSLHLMTFIGILDVIIALSALFRPVKALLLYATFWAFAAALMRPIAGGYILDFVERSSNFLAPLALYCILYFKDRKSS